MHVLFKWLYNRFSQVESFYHFSIFYLDFEFKILLLGEIYWKDKSTRLCKFLVDAQNYGGNSM